MVELGNFGLSQKTWGSYKTAERMWTLCQKQTKQQLSLPWGQRETIIFIDWLVHDRQVGAATISSYLAGIKKFHTLRGFDEPTLRTNVVNQMIKGKKNKETVAKINSPDAGRLPVTLTILKLIKEKIIRWQQPIEQKLLVWALCTVAFFGGFRIHELLARNESFYDPDFTLVSSNVRVTEFVTAVGALPKKVLEITVKVPKESKNGNHVVLDVFETGCSLCPVKAFTRWWSKTRTANIAGPLFREESGVPLTGRKFNTYLKSLLADTFDYSTGQITSHSFRSGLASELAARGVSIAELKLAGRWNSRSWMHYVKLPRAQRALLAEKIAQL